jgi:hypothetical protein
MSTFDKQNYNNSKFALALDVRVSLGKHWKIEKYILHHG